MSLELYECDNPACTLGSRKEPGLFTGGMTAEGVNLLTGEPVESLTEGKDFGEGICPNCGEKGKATGETHESVVGEDPYQAIHDEVAARVNDKEDPLDSASAQEAVLLEISKEEAPLVPVAEGGVDDE